jgi:hypothetical protein
MPAENHNGMQCNEFDALLSEALDQKLTGQALADFQAHAAACNNCGPLMSEAEFGQRWLKSLHEVDPPDFLINSILAATSGLDTVRMGQTAGSGKTTWLERFRVWADTVTTPAFAIVRQPRFVMSFGMVFFSLSITLSLAGVKLTDLRHADLRPSAIKHSYYETQGRVEKYYDNIRFVYQIESRVREFKRATTPVAPAPEEKDRRHRNDNTSGQPDPKPDRNYSQGSSQVVLAGLPNRGPVVIEGTSYRRLS